MPNQVQVTTGNNRLAVCTINTTAESGKITEKLMSRKDFRAQYSLTNAESKRQYRALQMERTKPNQASFNGLIADGYVCPKVTKTAKGNYTFSLTRPVDATASKAPSIGDIKSALASMSAEDVAALVASLKTA